MDRLPGEWPRKAQRQRVIAKAGSWLCTKDRLHSRPGWTTGQTAAMSENPTSYLLREDMATANTAPLTSWQACSANAFALLRLLLWSNPDFRLRGKNWLPG